MQLTIHTDGGSRGNPGPAASGVVVLKDGEHTPLAQRGELLGEKTNNEAEYLAFLSSLRWLEEEGLLHHPDAEKITWKLDSMLVVEQLNRHWKIKEARLQELAKECWLKLRTLPCAWQITYVPRAENAVADRVVNETLDQAK